jgi:hypothetical protein
VELVIFPDVESLAIQAIMADGRRGTTKWATQVPNPRPDEFGRLMRFGGPRETIVSEHAQLILEGWAQTETRALAILNFGRAILASQDGPLFGYSELSGPSNLPDPTTDQIRYTCNVSVRVRGTSLA